MIWFYSVYRLCPGLNRRRLISHFRWNSGITYKTINDVVCAYRKSDFLLNLFLFNSLFKYETEY